MSGVLEMDMCLGRIGWWLRQMQSIGLKNPPKIGALLGESDGVFHKDGACHGFYTADWGDCAGCDDPWGDL